MLSSSSADRDMNIHKAAPQCEFRAVRRASIGGRTMTEAAHFDRMVCESATYLRAGEAAVSDATGPDGPARDAGSRTALLRV